MGREGTHYRPPEELTARQLDVMRLLAKGKTNGEIASELGLTLDGVKWHVREILQRLDCETREEAVVRWCGMESPKQRARRWSLGLWGALAARPLVTAGIAGATMAAVTGIVVVAAMLATDGSADSEIAVAGPSPTEAALHVAGLDASDVRMLALRPGGPPRSMVPMPVDGDDPSTIGLIERLLNWVNMREADEVPYVDDIGLDVIRARSQTVLQLVRRDGRVWTIANSWNCVRLGDSVMCEPIDGKVDLDPGDGRLPIRVEAPELAAWIQRGWRADLELGTLAEFQAIWPPR